MIKKLSPIFLTLLFIFFSPSAKAAPTNGSKTQSLNKTKNGVTSMLVKKCGDKPNCVSSVDDRDSFFIEPIKTEKPKETFETLVKKMKSLKEATLLDYKEGKEAHFVFTTWLMSFKDDVYLSVNEKEQTIEIMSQSRVGYSDLGKNRKRLSKIKKLAL